MFELLPPKKVYGYGRLMLTFNGQGGCHDRGRMVVGFTTTYAISSHHS